ncbi:hypothetical protein L9F63_019216, partial [Diploptera punctata]
SFGDLQNGSYPLPGHGDDHSYRASVHRHSPIIHSVNKEYLTMNRKLELTPRSRRRKGKVDRTGCKQVRSAVGYCPRTFNGQRGCTYKQPKVLAYMHAKHSLDLFRNRKKFKIDVWEFIQYRVRHFLFLALEG